MARRVYDRSAIDDLTQETFTRVLSEVGNYCPREGKPFACWLLGSVASRTLADYGRSQWRHQRAVDDAADTARRGARGEHVDPDGQAVSSEVAQLLAVLTPAQRRYVELRYLDGLPAGTVAAVTGRAPATVTHACYEALARLRSVLAGASQQVPVAS